MELWHVSRSCSRRTDQCCRTCFPGYPEPPLPSVCTVPGAGAASSLEFHGGAASRGALAALVSPALKRNVRESARIRTESAQKPCAVLFFPRWLFPQLLGGIGCPSHPIPPLTRAVCHLLNLPPSSLWVSWAVMGELGSAGSSPGAAWSQAHLHLTPPGKRDVGRGLIHLLTSGCPSLGIWASPAVAWLQLEQGLDPAPVEH